MAAADEVQINVNDLMSAFAGEHGTVLQRAIVAEAKVKAYSAALQRATDELAAWRGHECPQVPEETPAPRTRKRP